MKKFIIPILFISLIVLGIVKYGAKGLFTPGAVQKVREKSIEELKLDAEENERLFEDELKRADRAGNEYEKLGIKYVRNRNWTPAIESLRKAIEMGASGARTHYFLGLAFANRSRELGGKDDLDSALRHYRRSIEINDKIPDSKYGLALALFYLKDDRKQGIRIMKKLTDLEPEYYRARFALGRFYYEENEAARALSVFKDLHDDLSKKKQTPNVKLFMKKTKESVSRLMMELSVK